MFFKAEQIVCGLDIIRVEGIFVYQNYKYGRESIQSFWNDFQSHAVSFDDCIGSYRIHIKRADGTELFFGDNAGARFWYIDKERGQILEKLSDIPVGLRKPNYASIAQFLWFGCIYGTETILQGICRTDPECYYVLKSGNVSSVSKSLTPLEQFESDKTALAEYMHRILKSIREDETIGCTITGGTDSRAILAHLWAAGVSPKLSITGIADHADVQIAEQISKIMGLELSVLSGLPAEGTTWLDETLAECDGQVGACGSYRLLQQFRAISTQGVSVQFGGMAGELYKNSFINQDYPFYFGKPNWQRFLRLKVITYNFPMQFCGEAIEQEMKKIPDKLLNMVQQFDGSTKASAYLNAGYRILQARASTLSMIANQYVITCNPLIERCVAAAMCREKPYTLEMQSYQRQQIAQFCPLIMDVRTDRGLTCNPSRKNIEWVKSMSYLMHVAIARLLKRNRVTGRIDPCMEQGLKSEQYRSTGVQCNGAKNWEF